MFSFEFFCEGYVLPRSPDCISQPLDELNNPVEK